MKSIFSIIRGRGTALRLPHEATARVRPYLLRRYDEDDQEFVEAL